MSIREAKAQDTANRPSGAESSEFEPTDFAQVASPGLIAHTELILLSYRRATGRRLLDDLLDPEVRADDDDETFSLARESRAKFLYEAPFVVVSHGTEESPLFDYGNQAAQCMFKLSWGDFVGLVSKKSAEADGQADRDDLLQRVAEKGWCTGYEGIRVDSQGRRLRIIDATVWNLTDEQGNYLGQAATYPRWEPV